MAACGGCWHYHTEGQLLLGVMGSPTSPEPSDWRLLTFAVYGSALAIASTGFCSSLWLIVSIQPPEGCRPLLRIAHPLTYGWIEKCQGSNRATPALQNARVLASFLKPLRPRNGCEDLRPDFHDHRGGIFCDSQGKFLETHSFRNVGDLKDLISVASDIVDLIIDMLQANVENPPAAGAPQPSGRPSELHFKDRCSDPAFEQPARGIVNSLMATGLVGMVSYKPLSLLNARLGRYPSARSSDMEIEVNSAIGALDVDVSDYLDAANEKAKNDKARISKEFTASGRQQAETKIDAAIHPFVCEGMLAELFKHYQWRMLLLATPRRALAGKDLTPASQPGLWSQLVRVPRHRPIITTPFTALENFMTTSLVDRFHPPSFRYKDNPLYLEQSFKLFDLKGYESPLWTKCMLYGHTTNIGSFVPTFQLVEWNQWKAVLGQDVVLVPLEYTGEGRGGEWQKRIRLRCVVLSNFAGGTRAFSKDQEGGAANLDLVGDVIIY
ncbi:uncharacterized protein B0I36DRAFT_436874 [Microdochium trichocladiopsis]|uniref:Uncharacterized protein n=1 Tax=Microdochium trichocladiopsis TaxID=1682393 RepID=A0A9P8XQ99_9PEZI|nr:uncharacterized protein B0I36DRAFT_436874 [Microdochium trichocladiopsis]KAH7010867.1 hypothetical protein B0I36DRAFT_436874 [Microdochium trichocladiopsis]